mgnify:CR=1 FL=1
MPGMGTRVNLLTEAHPSAGSSWHRSWHLSPNGNDKNNAATDWATTVNVTPGTANKP